MLRNMYSRIFNKSVFIAVIILTVVLLGGLKIMFYVKNPDIIFLSNRDGARWIKYDSEFELGVKPADQTKCAFKYFFNTNKRIDNAVISMQALKSASIYLDGVNVFSSIYSFRQWKEVHRIKIPFTVEAGAHEIMIIVKSEKSPPSVIASSESIPVKTGTGWFASTDGKNWRMAVPSSQVSQPAISRAYPSTFKAFFVILPYLAAVFVIVLLILLSGNLFVNTMQKIFNWMYDPPRIRWILLFLWTVLCVNNLLKLNFQVGSDIWGHIEYVTYIVTKGSLPGFWDGWQMHQGPLNYLLNAPIYAFFIKWFDLPFIVKIMTIIPVTCGLLQIEIVYRTARIVFADRKDLQIIAIVTGTLMPIHTYACQYVGNEPLAGCLTSIVILLCLPLVMPNQKERGNGYFVLIGFVWGLALLSKMTSAPIAAILIITLAFYTVLIRKPLKHALKPIAITFCTSMLISGWYIYRIYVHVGNYFIEKSRHSEILQWWQEPGYRTWSQVLSFGQSLVYPVYSGVVSFWDMLYSTLWLDGFNSGLIDVIPWNENFMLAGALLAILPSIFILTGIVSVWLNKNAVYRSAVIFSAGTIILFVVVLMDLYISNPIYSGTKSSYTLGLLPCYSILVAAGAEPFLRNRIIRSVAIACFACWAFAAYIAYFVVKLL